jgi:uncharacterized protein YdeI (YjbR/CyaY-like superfamily)
MERKEKHEEPHTELPTLLFAGAAAWSAWLAENHTSAEGVWLQLAKKGSGVESVTYAEAVEEALCYGWIDGQSRKYDSVYWLQRFTPRRARSNWSQINVEKVEMLRAAGRMQPAGLAEVARAQADGRWDAAYASPAKIEPPAEFLATLEANPVAKANFAALNGANRYALLLRVTTPKKPETRAKKTTQMIEMLNAGGRIYE